MCRADPFLAHDDGSDVRFGTRFDDRVDGIADQELDALALEDLCNGICYVHAVTPEQ